MKKSLKIYHYIILPATMIRRRLKIKIKRHQNVTNVIIKLTTKRILKDIARNHAKENEKKEKEEEINRRNEAIRVLRKELDAANELIKTLKHNINSENMKLISILRCTNTTRILPSLYLLPPSSNTNRILRCTNTNRNRILRCTNTNRSDPLLYLLPPSSHFQMIQQKIGLNIF